MSVFAPAMEPRIEHAPPISAVVLSIFPRAKKLIVAALDPLVPTNLLVPATIGIGSPNAASVGIVKMPPPPAIASINPAMKAMTVQTLICREDNSVTS